MIAAFQTAITISTYDRPDGLRLLLHAIDQQDLGDQPATAFSLIVVDNSQAGSAESVCTAYGSDGRFALSYIQEPRKGLSFARNAGLQAADRSGATHVVFVDDDEVPEPAWLAALHGRMQESKADAVIGVVHPIFEVIPPRWAVAGGFFAKSLPETHGLLADGYTSNALVDLALVRRHALSFDPRCNLTGGEDTLFFRDLMGQGGTIVLAPRAVVLEFIPARRVALGWLLRRWFRTGATEANLGRYAPASIAGRLHNGVRGLARIVAGTARIAAALPGGFRSPERLVGATYTLCRGAGLVSCVFGRRYDEYDAATYRPR